MTATESNEAPIISIQNVWKFFGQLTALHDVSFDVQPGERVVIIGPSGSGKSTLLRSINRLEVIDKGTILVEGSDINAPENDINKIRQDLGMVFQRFNLFPHMTAIQNIMLAPVNVRGLSHKEAEAYGMELLSRVGLADKHASYPDMLSGGQQQRAALARILAAKPRILMLDEPFSALDSYLREEVEGEVGSLLANFVGTALLVTHNRDEAYRLCKEMIVLNEGQVLRAGTTKAVFADPQSIAAARLTGCKNILPCTPLDSHTVRLDGWDTTLRLVLPVPAGCTAVGIRAHDFTPCAADAPNAIPVKAVSTSENPFDWNLICTSPEGAAQLWWKVGKTSLSAAAPEPPQYLCAAPESIMPLKG